MKYQVETFCLCGGWSNVWHCDDQLEFFSTYDEAKAALDEFFQDLSDEGLSEEYDLNDYRITEVKQ